jgi:orotidine-5'-phosphate decarboxylase
VAGVNPPTTPIVALDFPTAVAALALVDLLGDACRFYKIGSELYTAEGPKIVRDVQGRGAAVFLDLKFHDIPNTVAGAVRNAAQLGVRLLTVHASGGSAMLRAAAEAAATAPQCGVLAVTVLTSMDAGGLGESWGRTIPDVNAEVLRLAELASQAGLHGIVCSGLEAAQVRDRFSGRLATLVPGVRLAGGATQDQARVVTPRAARDAGARYIILGRAITAAAAPLEAMRSVRADLS